MPQGTHRHSLVLGLGWGGGWAADDVMHCETHTGRCILTHRPHRALQCDFKSYTSMKNELHDTCITSLKNVNILKSTDPTFLAKWCLLEGGFYSNCQRDSVVLVRRCCTCCPRRSWALREIRFLPQGAMPILPPNFIPPPPPCPTTPCCWHSHANSSPLVITLSLNQLTTTAGVRLLMAHCWMGGGMQASACECLCAPTCICSWCFYFGSFSSTKW